MNYAIYQFTLDLQKTMSPIYIPVTERDTKRCFMISLTNGGKPYHITDGCTATFSGKKADGTILYNDCTIIDNSVIRYDFTEQTTSAPGEIDCHIYLYGEDGEILASPRFTVTVYKKVIDIDGVTSENEKTSIENMIAREAGRIVAEEARKERFDEMVETFGNLGGVEVSHKKPTNKNICMWVDSDAEDEYVTLLTLEDIDKLKFFGATLSEVTLLASKWEGEGNLYSQVVEIEGTTEKSKVDLMPSAYQLSIFHNKDISFVTENEDGVVTVYCIGQKPQNDYTIQVTITEVNI